MQFDKVFLAKFLKLPIRQSFTLPPFCTIRYVLFLFVISDYSLVFKFSILTSWLASSYINISWTTIEAHNRDRPLLHITLIINIIFLFCTASANLIANFPLKPMGVCFLHYWSTLSCFKVSFYNRLVSYSHKFHHFNRRWRSRSHTNANIEDW